MIWDSRCFQLVVRWLFIHSKSFFFGTMVTLRSFIARTYLPIYTRLDQLRGWRSEWGEGKLGGGGGAKWDAICVSERERERGIEIE